MHVFFVRNMTYDIIQQFFLFLIFPLIYMSSILTLPWNCCSELINLVGVLHCDWSTMYMLCKTLEHIFDPYYHKNCSLILLFF
jgi:hypothetical protein